jgi:sulfite exporter TauE/SafE
MNPLEIILIGAALGAGGSLHCLGMCGPLVIAMKANQKANWFTAQQLGKVTIYTLFGIIAGAGGGVLSYAIDQQYFSILVGILMLASLVFTVELGQFFGKTNWLTKQVANLRNQALTLWPTPSLGKYYVLGLANGFLPCGLLYSAFIVALGTGSITGGMLLMFSFGIGTIPLLGIFGFGIQTVPMLRKMLSGNKVATFFQISISILLIVRGLGLGIPYVSPTLPTTENIKTSTYHCATQEK